MMRMRNRQAAARAAGAVVVALIAGGCAVPPGGGTPRPSDVASMPSAAVAGGAPARARAAAAPAPRIPLAVPNSVRARKAVTLTDCTASGAGGHATGTVTAPGTSAATYTITVFFTTRQATVIGYGTAKVRAVPGKATPWAIGRDFKAPPGMRCVLRGVSTSYFDLKKSGD